MGKYLAQGHALWTEHSEVRTHDQEPNISLLAQLLRKLNAALQHVDGFPH